MEEKKVKIYILIDPVTKRVRYVGKTENSLNVRLRGHINCKKGNIEKMEWIQSLLRKGIKPEIQLIDIVNLSNWTESETYWIKYYGELHGNLLNKTSGGQCGYGLKPRNPHTKEFKQRMSEIHKGNKYCLGRKDSIESRKKRSESLKRCYAEGRRISIIYGGWNSKRIKVYDSNMMHIYTFDSSNEAARKLGINRRTIQKHFKKRIKKPSSGYYFELL